MTKTTPGQPAAPKEDPQAAPSATPRRTRRPSRAQLHRQRDELLANVVARLAENGLNYQEALDTVVRGAVEALGGAAAILLLSPERSRMQMAAVYHPDPALVADIQAVIVESPLLLNEGLAGQLFATRKPVLLNNMPPAQLGQVFNRHYTDELIHFGAHSILAAPIIAGERVLGMLAIGHFEEGEPPFTDEDARFSLELAARAALALEYARLLRSEQEARRRAELLQAANLALSQTLDRHAVLERLLDFLAQVIPYDSANTMLLDRDAVLHLHSLRGYERWTDQTVVRAINFDSRSTPHLHEMIEERRSLLVPDTHALPSWDPVPGSEHIRSWLGVPLIAGGRVVGLYSLDKTTPGFFTAEHQQIAEALAAQAAVAIENAELYEAEQHAREQAETLSAASVALSRELDIDSVLATLLDYLGQLIPYDSAATMLIGADGRLRLHSFRGYEHWSDVQQSSSITFDPHANPVLTRIISDARSMMVPDTYSDPGWGPHNSPGQTHSWMGVPMVVGGKVVGLYSLDKAEIDFFTAEHLRLAEGLAAHAGVAVENARLYSQTQEASIRNAGFAAHLSSLLESTNAGFYGIDRDNHCTFINRAGAELLGYRPEEIVGREMHALIHNAHADGTPYPREESPIYNSARSGVPCRVDDDVFWRKDGSSFDVGYSSQPIIEANGEHNGAVVAFADVSLLKRAEEARRARDAAEQANQAKSEFLSRMSHELRTPLNSILGFTQILQTEETNAERREYLMYILQGGHHLLGLINEVLDMSRIETGRLILSTELVRVDEVLRESLDIVWPLASERSLKVNVDFAEFRGLSVQADRQRLRQVLINLLSNAVKYNRPQGNIDISCALQPEQDAATLAEAQGAARRNHTANELYSAAPPGPVLLASPPPNASRRLRLLIGDNGPGIEADKLPRLFVPFDRLGAEQSEIEGTGLGLALSKLLIEAMGGEIGVISQPGSGSTFWIELPVLIGEDAALLRRGEQNGERQPVPNRELDLPRSNVLYIEDNVFNRKLVQRIISTRPYIKLTTSPSVGELDRAALKETDLILLDLNLPGVSGDEFLAQLKGDPTTSSIPVVIISADATNAQVENLLAAGASAYLTKPIDIETFFKVLDDTLKRPE